MAEKKQLSGKLFDIQGFSVHDGPGIRTTLFLKGCPLRCPWCHSPESLEFDSQLSWQEKKCIGAEKCGRCIEACPRGAISSGSIKTQRGDVGGVGHVTVDHLLCTRCGACAEACAAGAFIICGTDYTVGEIMDRVRRDQLFYKRSGGGVTISGGECLHQPEFTLEILKRCKEERLHTAVDTSGYAKWEIIEQILPYTDIFLYDIKGIDGGLHKQATGVSNEQILENARKIAAAGGKLHIRLPVVPMYSDSADVFADIGRFILKLGNAVEMVHILPYHNLGTDKWKRLQTGKPIFEAAPPSAELIQSLKKQLEDMGLNVVVH